MAAQFVTQAVAHGAEMEIDNPGMGAAMGMSFGAKPTFPRVNYISQNECARSETRSVGTHESRPEIGIAGEEDWPQGKLAECERALRRGEGKSYLCIEPKSV
jgi:hypothetical protein